MPTGSYAMTGTFDGDQLRLTGVGWLQRPSGSFMVGLSGTYTAGPEARLAGDVVGQSCTTFELTQLR